MKNITLKIVIIICLFVIIGLAIWLGFPSPNYNRIPVLAIIMPTAFIILITCFSILMADSY